MRCLPLPLILVACVGGPGGKDDGVIDTGPDDFSCPALHVSGVDAWEDAELLGREPPEVQGGNAGIGLGDLDGDGWLDALVVTPEGSMALGNDGTGTLVESTALTFDGGALPAASGVALGDLDGDGDLDAWLGRQTTKADLVAINDGTGRFTLREIAGSEAESFTGSLGDLDGDGDLDLFVARYATTIDPGKILDGTLTGGGNAVYANDGTGVFTEVEGALPAEVVDDVSFMGSLVDTDADGDLDVYLANDYGPFLGRNRLLINDGTGRFTADDDCFCDLAMFAMGVGVGDANADGLVDLFLTDLAGPDLLLNAGDGTFYEGGKAMGATVPNSETHLASWGTSFVDLDLDGFEDLAMVFGPLFPHGDPDGLGELGEDFEDWVDGPEQQDVILESWRGEHFENVSSSAGFTDPSKGRALAVGDLDNDGKPDLVTAGLWFVRTWRTSGGCDNSVKITFAGEALARAPGGRLDLVREDGTTATRWLTQATTWSSSAPELILGLGEAEALSSMTWRDATGAETRIEAPQAGDVVIIGETR